MRVPMLNNSDKNEFRKEHFAASFTVFDAKLVCIAGLHLEDKIVYRCAQYFVSKSKKPLFLESPSLVHCLVHMDTLDFDLNDDCLPS